MPALRPGVNIFAKQLDPNETINGVSSLNESWSLKDIAELPRGSLVFYGKQFIIQQTGSRVKNIYPRLLTNETNIDDYVCHTSNRDSQEDINKIIYYTARHQQVGVILVVHSIFKAREAFKFGVLYF